MSNYRRFFFDLRKRDAKTFYMKNLLDLGGDYVVGFRLISKLNDMLMRSLAD